LASVSASNRVELDGGEGQQIVGGEQV
jgi:hypothetical protein